jgi:feruloyl esterase
VKYYDQVQARDPKAGDYFRMFMMPGVLHCAGGPGPTRRLGGGDRRMGGEGQGARPPDRAEALRSARATSRAAALCPYPQRAVYYGPAAPTTPRTSPAGNHDLLRSRRLGG